MQWELIKLTSLGEFDIRLPLSRRRLQAKDYAGLREATIARLWDAYNTNPGHAPAEKILSKSKWADDLFYLFGNIYYPRLSVAALSSLVQWLATNVGTNFVEERCLIFSDANVDEMCLSRILHRCNERCGDRFNNPLSVVYDPHYYLTDSPDERQLAQAVLSWLGSEEGKLFWSMFKQTMQKL